MNVHPVNGSRLRIVSSQSGFPAWCAVVREGRFCIIGGGSGAWSDTADGFVMPWAPVLGWIELHDDGTYEIVYGGPPREVVDSGTWQYV